MVNRGAYLNQNDTYQATDSKQKDRSQKGLLIVTCWSKYIHLHVPKNGAN